MRSWFANPWAFSLLGLMPLLSVLGLIAWRRRRQALSRLGSAFTLAALLPAGRRAAFVRRAVVSLGLTLLVVGAAGPQWGRDYSQAIAPGRDLVVVLDLSRSMFAEQPSRLHRATTALTDLADTLKQRGGHRMGLVVFAGRARVACPLTHDYDHFREIVTGFDPERPPPDLAATDDEASGTRIGLGLREALALHDARHRGFQEIILLSDGDDPARDGEWRLPAAEARRDGVPIHTVGLGDPEQRSPIPLGPGRFLEHDGARVLTRLEEGPLREIAEITEGTYTPARTQALPLGKLFREVIEPRGAREESDDALPMYQQRYAWFLGAALFLLSAELALGGRTRRNPPPVAPPSENEEGAA